MQSHTTTTGSSSTESAADEHTTTTTTTTITSSSSSSSAAAAATTAAASTARVSVVLETYHIPWHIRPFLIPFEIVSRESKAATGLEAQDPVTLLFPELALLAALAQRAWPVKPEL